MGKPSKYVHTGGEGSSAHKKFGDMPGSLEDADVDDVAIGASSTQWGGKGADGKAKGTLRADLNSARNMDDGGPFGAPRYGVPKKDSKELNAKSYK